MRRNGGEAEDSWWRSLPPNARNHMSHDRFFPPMNRPARSLYLPMHDGVKLGVDLFLPEGTRTYRLPTIVHFTRYYRGIAWTPLLEKLGFGRLTDVTRKARERFLAAGYAWVAVDARGSGASFGSRPCEWSSKERRDQREVLDWIMMQPWSTGRIGALGISYSGTCAEFLRIDGHPGLRAVAPLYSLFDVYEDVACPGGVQLSWFTKTWGAANNALDRNALHEVITGALQSSWIGKSDFHRDRKDRIRAKLFSLLGTAEMAHVTSRTMQRAVHGVRDVSAKETPHAIAEHGDNYDVHASVENIVFRDDTAFSKELGHLSPEAFSPHTYVAMARSSKVPILSVGGWHDSGYANAAAKRHASLADSSASSYLLLGPWDHGGTQDTSPFGIRSEPAYDHIAEYIRFFDAYLRMDAAHYAATPRVRYFTMGAETWRSSEVWPPSHMKPTRFRMGRGGKLAQQVEAAESFAPYTVDTTLGSGVRSRWRSLIQLRAPVGYSDRAPLARRMLTFTGEPLAADLEITGHPEAHLFLRAAASDATLFVYLEEVSPTGRVQYITEGMFRALHRKRGVLPHTDIRLGVSHTYQRGDALPLEPGAVAEIAFALQPTSYVVPKGHALRVSIAGCDVDNFATVAGSATSFEVRVGGNEASYVELPIAP